MFLKKLCVITFTLVLLPNLNAATVASFSYNSGYTTFFHNSVTHPAPSSYFYYDDNPGGSIVMKDDLDVIYYVSNANVTIGTALGDQALLADNSGGGDAEGSFAGGSSLVTSFSINGDVLSEAFAWATVPQTATPLLTGYIEQSFLMEEDDLGPNIVNSEGLKLIITGGVLVDTGMMGLSLPSNSNANVSMALISDSVNNFSTTDLDISASSSVQINIIPEPLTIMLFGVAGLYGRKRVKGLRA